MLIPKNVLELYLGNSLPNIAYIYGRWLFNNFELIESLLPKDGKILDIGCGFGLLSNYAALKSAKREVIGVDLSRKRINVAKSSVNGRNNVMFKVEDVKNLTSVKFDAMIMTDFLHHINYDEQNKIIKYAYKNLKVGGTLIIKDVDKRRGIVFFFHANIDKYLWNFGGDIFFFPSKNLEKRLNGVGFKVRRVDNWNRAFSCESLFVCEKAL